MKGSTTMPLPRGSAARTICLMKACGFSDGWGAVLRSIPLQGLEMIRSENGFPSEGLLSAPAFHFFKFSLTVPLRGFRKNNHGSQELPGGAKQVGKALGAALGR